MMCTSTGTLHMHLHLVRASPRRRVPTSLSHLSPAGPPGTRQMPRNKQAGRPLPPLAACRHVRLPPDIVQLVPKGRLMSEVGAASRLPRWVLLRGRPSRMNWAGTDNPHSCTAL